MANRKNATNAHVLPVVEITRNKSKREAPSRSRSRNLEGTDEDSYEDGYSDEELSLDESFDDDNDEQRPLSTRRTPSPTRPPSRFKSLNGKKKVDMTPPDEKLRHSEKLAIKYSREGKPDAAIREYINCMAYSRIIYGPSHWKHCRSIANLSEAYLNLKDYAAQAEYHADNAKSIMLQGGHTTDSDLEKADLLLMYIKVYRTLGQASTQLKKYGAAENAFSKADKVSIERGQLRCVPETESDELDVLLYLAMARCYAKQKKHALATTKFDKALEIGESVYGPDSPYVMKIYSEYGKFEESKGRYCNHEKAIEMFLQAHSICSSIHKEGHPELVDSSLNLAQAYANSGWEEAEGSALSYLEDCLSTCTAIHGPNHKKTLQVQDHLARQYIRMDKTQDAMSILTSSLPSKFEVFGEYSDQVASTYKLMASVHLAEGNLEKSLSFYKKCHQIELLTLGKRHQKTKDTQKTMEMLMASPSLSHKFVLDKEKELQKRPRFNNVVRNKT